MSEEQTTAKLKVLLYSDDRVTRDEVRLALGRRIAQDLPELEIFDVATHRAVEKAVAGGGFDVLVLDGEAVPSGGMGLCHQLKDELPDCPPVVLLVARVADAWLASWSKAETIVPLPIDPVRLPNAVADTVRQARSQAAAR